MPVSVRHLPTGGYRVRTPGGVKAYHTSKTNAQRQTRLLHGVEHGWKPTGAPARENVISTQAKLLVDEVITQARQLHEVAFVKAGDRVHHKKYGTGTVKHMIGTDAGAMVKLDKGGTKKITFSDNDSDTGWRRGEPKKK
jgi:hypothetical protein